MLQLYPSFLKIAYVNYNLKLIFFYIVINKINYKNLAFFFNPQFLYLFKKSPTKIKINQQSYKKIFRFIRQNKNSFKLNRTTGKIKLKFSNFFYFNEKKTLRKIVLNSSKNNQKYYKRFMKFFLLSYRCFFYKR